jgi:3-deoxy-7-phosphoheptulonate synthase
LDGFIVLDGSCTEPVRLDMPIQGLAEEALATDGAVRQSKIGLTMKSLLLPVKRGRGQGVKPRSSATETVTEDLQTEAIRAGETVASFLGEGVNGIPVDQRRPQPNRMVAMAVQARDLEEQLTATIGHHVPAAHEALLLPYERAQIVEDKNGKRYLLSADLPWVGARTNDPEGEHVTMLSGVENAVGVKISASSDAAHIKALAEKLNPNDKAGKLVFMMRLGAEKVDRLGEVLDAIREHAKNAVVMYDIHGVTKTNEHKEKIRAVPDIIDEIKQLTEACNNRGLRMSGLHLETMGDDHERECIDEPGERPSRPGNVDPRLNPGQLRRILDAIAETVLNQEFGRNLN